MENSLRSEGPPKGGTPLSAAQLAEELGGLLPGAEEVPAEAFELVEAVRELVEATVTTAADPAERAAAAASVRALAAGLCARSRPDPVWLVRHRDGRVEHLTQTGSGRLNPRAPRLEFVGLRPPPPAGVVAVPLEVRARCELGAAHGGGPGRAHGSVVAGLLDEVLGVAAVAAGAPGLTVALEVRFRAATPYGVPLVVTGRLTRHEGRKSYAAGEVRAGDVVTAEATAVFVAPARPRAGTEGETG